MEAAIDNAIAEMALKVGPPASSANAWRAGGQMAEPRQEPVLEIHNSGPMIGKVSANLAPSVVGSSKKEAGRNDPCPCGSGKKYKKCHGA